jgi:ATP-dependent DNA helicase RecG
MDSGGLMEELIERMRPFVSEDAAEVTDGVRRDRRWSYPLEALREALVNAFAHRDWTRIEDVEVVRYASRLEIKSPGALPNSMTVEKMLAGQRSARNPLIVEVLRDYGYVDARGMGVRTKIVPLLEQYNGIRPDLEPTEDFLMVRMHRGPGAGA